MRLVYTRITTTAGYRSHQKSKPDDPSGAGAEYSMFHFLEAFETTLLSPRSCCVNYSYHNGSTSMGRRGSMDMAHRAGSRIHENQGRQKTNCEVLADLFRRMERTVAHASIDRLGQRNGQH